MKYSETRRQFLKTAAISAIAAGLPAVETLRANSAVQNSSAWQEKLGRIERITHYGPEPERGEWFRSRFADARFASHRREISGGRDLVFLEGSGGAAVVRIERSGRTVVLPVSKR